MRFKLRLTKREKILIFLLLIGACAYLYLRLIYLPEMKRYAALGEEFNQKLKLLDSVNNKEERIDEINKEISILDKEISSKRDKLSKPLFLPDVLEDLHRQSLKYGVTVDNIAFSGAASDIVGTFNDINNNRDSISDQEDKGFQETPVDLAASFTFSAGYDNLMNFIKHYEEGQRYVVIEVLDMRNIEDIFTGSMTMRFYMIG